MIEDEFILNAAMINLSQKKRQQETKVFLVP